MEEQFRSMRLHIKYLRSLEDTDRTRQASVQYLQNWLIEFYPDRLDIVREAERLAADLGGRLKIPKLSWKYEWIRRLFGWKLAKEAQIILREAKGSVLSGWEQVLFRFERQKVRVYE